MAADDEKRPSNGDNPVFIRITNQAVYTELQAVRADVRDLIAHVSDYPEVKTRVKKLELKFYGILAGLIAAIGVIIANGGRP